MKAYSSKPPTARANFLCLAVVGLFVAGPVPASATGDAAARDPIPSNASEEALVLRQGGTLLVIAGAAEGLSAGDTCLFVKYWDLKTEAFEGEWHGYGRVTYAGPGGAEGASDRSEVTVIEPYGGPDRRIRVVPAGQWGLQFALGMGTIPMAHPETQLAANEHVIPEAGQRIALTGELAWRLRTIPIAELYVTGRIVTALGSPNVSNVFLEPGLAKGWLFGQFSPRIGARYSAARLSILVPAQEIAGSPRNAIAWAHGVEVYGGLSVLMSAKAILHFDAGYRLHSIANQFKAGDDVYYFRAPDDETWTVDFAGFTGRGAIAYEF